MPRRTKRAGQIADRVRVDPRSKIQDPGSSTQLLSTFVIITGIHIVIIITMIIIIIIAIDIIMIENADSKDLTE